MLKNEAGQDLVEYSLLVALLAVAVITLLNGPSISPAWTKAVRQMMSPKAKHKILGTVYWTWPKKAYERTSATVEIEVAPPSSDAPTPRSDQQQANVGLAEITSLPRPRMRISLSSDDSIQILEPKTQEKEYDPSGSVQFSWSIYAREIGDHTIEARLLLERTKDKFLEVSVSPIRMPLKVNKLDHIGRNGVILGTLAVSLAGLVLVILQIIQKSTKKPEEADAAGAT